jgi:hypothetical protein
MRKLPVRIGSVVAAASAALMLAGGTALASAASPARPAGPAAKTTTTGPEVVSGSAHGKAAIGGRAHRRPTTPSGGFLRSFRKVS